MTTKFYKKMALLLALLVAVGILPIGAALAEEAPVPEISQGEEPPKADYDGVPPSVEPLPPEESGEGAANLPDPSGETAEDAQVDEPAGQEDEAGPEPALPLPDDSLPGQVAALPEPRSQPAAQALAVIEGGIHYDEIDSSDEYLYFGINQGYIAVEDVSHIYLDFGRIYCTASLSKGDKISTGEAASVTDAEWNTASNYDEIIDVISVSLSPSLQKNTFFIESDHLLLYVYDKNLNFLGTSQGGFPYRETYFVAVTKLGTPIPARYKLTYAATGADEGEPPVDNNLYYEGQQVVIENSSDLFKRGYRHIGWSLQPNADWMEDDFYNIIAPIYNQKFLMPGNDVTLHPVWRPDYPVVQSNEIPFTSSVYPSLENLELSSGSVIRFELDEKDFYWYSSSPLTLEMVLGNDYDTRIKVIKNSVAVIKAQLEEYRDGVCLALYFTEDNLKDEEFSLEIYLVQNGIRVKGTETLITGTLKSNGKIPPDEGNNGNNGNNGGGSSGGSGSSKGKGSGGGGNRTGSGTAAPATPIASTLYTAVNETEALTRLKEAIGNAPNAGKASLRLKNVNEVSLSTLQALAKEAGSLPTKLHADSMNGNRVDVRVTIDPALASTGLKLYASTTSPGAAALKAKFEKQFDNTVLAVSFHQREAFGQQAGVAVLVKGVLNTETLYLYRYNSQTKTYALLNASYTVDKEGYLRFSVAEGGDVIITDSPLAKK